MIRLLKSLGNALSFLTILPWTKAEVKEEELAGASAWFPLAGYFLGAIYFGLARALYGRWPEPLISFVILALMAAITGGLHLDGLSDWADSLGGRDKKQRLMIMRDSRSGSFGIIAICLVLIGKMAALCLLIAQKNFLSLFLAAGLARLSLTIIISTTPYARIDGGTGEVFSRFRRKWHLAIALLIALAPVILIHQPFAWLGLAAVILISGMYRLLGMRLLGGFTGDLLGASVEVCEFAILFLAAALNSG